MILLDLKGEDRIDSQSLCYIDKDDKWSPYENWTVRAIPRMTILRGEAIMRDGEMLVKPGFGKCLMAVR